MNASTRCRSGDSKLENAQDGHAFAPGHHDAVAEHLPNTLPVTVLQAATIEVAQTPAQRVRPADPPPTPAAKLKVIRGLRLRAEFPLYLGANLIGRQDESPVDVNVSELEASDRTWASRQHATVTATQDGLIIEDLNSANGTFVNRQRVYPGQKRTLTIGDIVQIGTIQFKVIP